MKKQMMGMFFGFTLIELLIAVAIVGILSAIAYPSYVQYVERSHINDGRIALMEVAQTLEAKYVDGGYPVEDALDEIFDDANEMSAYYTISCAGTVETGADGADDDNCNLIKFTLQATANSKKAGTTCNSMTLNNRGETDPEDCWTK